MMQSRLYQLVIGVCLVLVAILVLPGPALAQQKAKLRPLHIALANHSVSMTAIYVAKQLGIFESYGYDARVLVLEPRAGIGALLSGDLDCYTAIGSTARAALRGAPVRVGLVALNRSDFILVARKEIASIDQLRGKLIGGYTPQGTVNVVLGELLRRKGLPPEEYKVVNAGTARAAALSSGAVPAALLNSVETVRLVKQGFHVLARASDELEMPQSGLGMSVAAMQSRRDFLRPVAQAVLEAIRVIVTQREKTLPVLMKQLGISQEEATFIYDSIHKGWALDGKPTPAALKLELELDQRDAGLKELPKPEQIYDFSILDEPAKR
ncbi:MAG TPA: ABC transporter substrate-binding protein [Candidatus Binatia bacterium]|nr:ABC transporter substrate-binding protein [Candidatus Binatia bacterium]